MVSAGVLPAKGFLRQEAVPLSDFLATVNGARYEASAQATAAQPAGGVLSRVTDGAALAS
jgi:hypothetical protein